MVQAILMMSDGNQAYEMTDDCFISMIADSMMADMHNGLLVGEHGG